MAGISLLLHADIGPNEHNEHNDPIFLDCATICNWIQWKNVLKFKCLLPTAGDIIYLCWIYVILIQAPIFFISVYQFFKIEPAILNFFGICYEPQKSMDSNFIQKAMDDPLSYSALWSEERYKNHMTRATIPETAPPIVDKKST